MGGVAVTLLAVLAAVSLRGPSSQMGYLYTDLDPAAAQSITEKLKAQNVPFQISADGTGVLAPQDKLAELRMGMASEQLGGKIGYDVLDQEEPFGVSSSRAKMNETRAIEGELSRSIESLQSVTKARVHIVMPERAMFAAEARKATAAVTVKTRGSLPGESVQAIRYLVASSVPELSPESVSVVDQTGALLARAGEGGGASSSEIEQRQAAVEARLRSQIEAMIEPIVGVGKVRAEVSAVIDREQTREEANVFDPDTQVIKHQVSVESNDQNQEQDAADDAVTVAAQLPENQGQPVGGGGDTRQSTKAESSEDITYENSSRQSVTVRTPGKINRLTVAVLVDGGAKGVPDSQLKRLNRLVENAVGFDAERGDSVVVESMTFATPEDPGADAGFLGGLTMDHVFDLLKILVIAGVGLMALRMLRDRERRRATDMAEVPEAQPALPPAQDPEMLALASRAADGDEDAMRQLEARNDAVSIDQEIALAQVDGRIKMSALKRIGEAVKGSPGESASVVRQWMNS
ncbi:flagellar basal-body MS-ring/collar protein FliF [Sphingomonas sp. LY54]|uniref:flagellar basal-body MS-ring/collar protein FliF n=1 Tax=Sphingomonadales TaxID=204457 RepID=UPI002D7765AF|nr:flagellar basal-body MS-ring/collar protein FliF [Sphingomonas sp. LY54]WRP30211.1 flagellar basal-body MS-ring/collar protein FliF [Sphingomonas sp. LY54]